MRLIDSYGDLDDLVGTPILEARETSNQHQDKISSTTWTFYTFRTIHGTVDLRWQGDSNGCYSERVHFAELTSVVMLEPERFFA